MTATRKPTTERDLEAGLEHDVDAFETEAGIGDLLRAYDQAEVAYLRAAASTSETPTISYSINSRPITTGRPSAG